MKSYLDFSQLTSSETPKGHAPTIAGLHLSPVFSNLPESVVANLAARTHQQSVSEGDVLCHQGDVAHTLWLVINGWVKLTRDTLDGSEAVWDVLGQGHIIGLETLLDPFQYTVRAVAVGDAILLALPHSVMRNILDTTPAFARELLGYVSRRQQWEMLEIEHRAHQTAPQRIGCFLLKLAGTPKSGFLTLNLPFDKGLLAARLGMQPETFSRALTRLKTDTGTTIEGSRIGFDIARLESYTCGACSGAYPCC